MKMNREFYKPAEYSAKVEREGVAAEVYLVDGSRGPVAVGFGGKRSKPDFHFRFGNEAKRNEYVENYLNRMEEIEADKKKEAEKKKNFVHSLKVGSILSSSWGYDQTNIDFYEVVEVVGKKSVKILPIDSAMVENKSDYGAIYVVAVPGSYKEGAEPALKRVKEGNVVKVREFANAYPWDGKPEYETAAGWGH